MAFYLDFEKTLKQIDDDIINAKIKGDDDAVNILKKDLAKETSKIYSNLSSYQRLQLARHPDRPHSADYVKLILRDFYEIHGDRCYKDDPAIVCFAGYLANKKLIIIGEQKGNNTKDNLKRNFGMPHPEGYRKALRVAKMAEKFQIPILFLIDTPGAYPGIGAEERGQSGAIATNLFELSSLKTITIAIVIGEGGSGGALALGVADKLAMMENSIFSVISPEGCAAILWDNPEKIEQASKVLKITASELKEQKLIDDLIKEPQNGAHRDKEGAAISIATYVSKALEELENIDKRELVANRMQKILSHGVYQE